jgi:cell division transport system ATP-binding protein
MTESVKVIELKNVSKKYPNGTVALKDINIKINKGEFAFIVGPSGSGKSTIIKLIFKEEDPSEGEVFVNGFQVNEMQRKQVPYLRRSLGMVFQDFRLLQNKTVYENVAFALQITEALPREIRRQVPMALALVGLSKKANVYPSQLSGGEQQRVVMARALVNNPSLLIADEPTGNLDPETSWEIIKLLSEVNQRGTTVVIATHEKSIVDLMKKRVIALDKGILIRDQQKGSYEDEDKNYQVHN